MSAGWLVGCARPGEARDEPRLQFRSAIRQIEIDSGGRLGVAVLNTATGAAYAHRGDERFPLCSTFKLLVAAQVLAWADGMPRGHESLQQRVVVRAEDLVAYSPVTEPRVGGVPMTLAELCEAAITLSDNTAANLLLRHLGGPQGLTAYVRGLGDAVTRLDRIEPELNQALPGDERDTTTPRAMLETVRRLVLGDALKGESRAQLTAWLLANRTGDRKLRARLPQGWRVGDKTGSGAFGTSNDVGLLWPPGGQAPVLVCCYLTGTTAEAEVRDRVHADVGWLVAGLAGA